MKEIILALSMLLSLNVFGNETLISCTTKENQVLTLTQDSGDTYFMSGIIDNMSITVDAKLISNKRADFFVNRIAGMNILFTIDKYDNIGELVMVRDGELVYKKFRCNN